MLSAINTKCAAVEWNHFFLLFPANICNMVNNVTKIKSAAGALFS